LSKIETGKRKATPTIIQGYLDVLGDDVNRRQLLLALLAGSTTPLGSVEMVGRAFELAFDAPALTVDDWLGKLEAYGRDYLSYDAVAIQARLATDLALIHNSVGHPALTSVAAKLLTLQGLTMQTTTVPTSDGRRTGAIRWYMLGARAADRSEDTSVRIWVRGRAASRLAVEGTELPAATCLAKEALALSEQPSLGRLNAQLALAQVQGSDGDRAGALATLDDARRTFDVVGSDGQTTDFAFPEWRMESLVSLVASRLGDERLTLESQESAERAFPADLPKLRFGKYLQLHRALMMVNCGDQQGGLTYARDTLDRLPPDEHRPALRVLMSEIESA
jgi:hypothetical protein